MVGIEVNSTGQFAHLLRAMTGRKVDAKILKYDGRPFSPEEILERLKETVKVPVLA
jgi:2-oxoglutarate ferredoxin oxidoreductase subunit alpha